MAVLTTLRDLVWMVVGVLVAALVAEMVIERVPKGPPITFHAVEVLTPRVPQGGTLVLRVSATKRRDECRWNVNRFLATDEDELLPLPVSTEIPLLGPGSRTLTVGIQLPTDLEPGRYRYLSVAEYDCPDRRYAVRLDPVPFEVVVAPAAAAAAGAGRSS